MHQPELGRVPRGDHHVDALDAERRGARIGQVHRAGAGHRVGGAGVQPEPVLRRGCGHESASGQPVPQPLVGRRAQRGPRPVQLGVHADHTDPLAAHVDLGPVQRQRLPDPGRLGDAAHVGGADAGGIDHREVGQHDALEHRDRAHGSGRRGCCGGDHGTARWPGDDVHQPCAQNPRHSAENRSAPPRGAACRSRLWRSAPPKATHVAVHHNRGSVMSEDGTPQIHAKDT